MKAELLYRFREDYSDGAILEAVIWRVPKPVGSVHIPTNTGSSTVIPGNGWWVMTMNGARVITGIRVTRKSPIIITTAEKLVDDFLGDIDKLRSDT